MLALSAAVLAVAAPDILVVGGTGRVGASTPRWLADLTARAGNPAKLAVGGRSAPTDSQRSRLPQNTKFVEIDLDGGDARLREAVAGRSLVIHTAGPFQQRTDPALLRAAIAEGVPYCDVCDELPLARNARALASSAAAPCVVSCGIWPGVSALMAAEAVEKLGGEGACERLEFSFFTAGTGGAGPTIVSATFLLLATKVARYIDGALVEEEPWLERRVRDFGEGVGEHECYTLDNPDVPTTAEALGIQDCVSRFGTYPSFWNNLFGGLKAALPTSLLMDRDKMQGLALFSMPIIRAVDALVGGTNAMRVDAWGKDGRKATLRVAHKDLEDCVGQATAAFGLELLRGDTIKPGVWYPAELGASARANILEVARERAFVWEVD